MARRAGAALTLALLLSPAVGNAAPDLDALRVLDGAWDASLVSADGSVSHLHLVNRCGPVSGGYFCAQTVDGRPGASILYQQGAEGWTTVLKSPDGASSLGRLTIAGAVWTYLSQDRAAWTRNTNTFSGRDHIHFQIETSTDGGQTWTPGLSGDEVRSRPEWREDTDPSPRR